MSKIARIEEANGLLFSAKCRLDVAVKETFPVGSEIKWIHKTGDIEPQTGIVEDYHWSGDVWASNTKTGNRRCIHIHQILDAYKN